MYPSKEWKEKKEVQLKATDYIFSTVFLGIMIIVLFL